MQQERSNSTASINVATAEMGLHGCSTRTNSGIMQRFFPGGPEKPSASVPISGVTLNDTKDPPRELPSPYDFYDLEAAADGCVPLTQCIESKATNVAGRGFTLIQDIEVTEGMTEAQWQAVKLENKRLDAFFRNLNPNGTATSLFIQTYTHYEKVGNAYWEVIRSGEGNRRVVAINLIEDPKSIRLCAKDKASTIVDIRYRVGNEYESYKYERRFRRFKQRVDGKDTYFREFGDPRQMDKYTGEYGDYGSIHKSRRATEIIHFKIPNTQSEYGIPRWVVALADVLAARAAKICNLDLLDNSATPPLAVLISGAEEKDMRKKIIDQLEEMKGSRSRSKVLVIELGMGEAGEPGLMKPVLPTIEFKPLSEVVVKEGFFLELLKFIAREIYGLYRIPPLLLGNIEDTPNKSTAEVAKRVAEEQVFGPARAELNDFINQKLLADEVLDIPGRKERSALYWLFALSALGYDRTEDILSVLKEGKAQGALTPNQVQPIINELLGDYHLEGFDDPRNDTPVIYTLDAKSGAAPEEDVFAQLDETKEEVQRMKDIISRSVGAPVKNLYYLQRGNSGSHSRAA
jgi:PBSX family phage portal protein